MPTTPQQTQQRRTRKTEKDKVSDVLDDTPYLNNQFNDDIDINSLNYLDSKTKIKWKCDFCGYEWEATINSRLKGCQCPRCTAEAKFKKLEKTLSVKYGSIGELGDKVTAEWLSSDSPYEISTHNHKPYEWKCSTCGAIYKMSPFDKFVKGKKCPECLKRENAKAKYEEKMFNLYGKDWRRFVNKR